MMEGITTHCHVEMSAGKWQKGHIPLEEGGIHNAGFGGVFRRQFHHGWSQIHSIDLTYKLCKVEAY